VRAVAGAYEYLWRMQRCNVMAAIGIRVIDFPAADISSDRSCRCSFRKASTNAEISDGTMFGLVPNVLYYFPLD
jgi:hypothetical protein